MATIEEIAGGVRELAFYELLRQRLCKSIPVASPAAGAEWSVAVPPGAAWELLAVKAILVTSAAVANRNAYLAVLDGNAEIARFNPQSTEAQSLTFRHYWSKAIGNSIGISGSVGVNAVLGEVTIPGGGSVGSVTGNIDAADQYSGINVFVREWSVENIATQADWIAHRGR